MRSNLKPFIGKTLLLIGHYGSSKTQPDGKTRHLLSKPSLYRFNPYSRRKLERDYLASVDHLWIYDQEKLTCAGEQLYKPHFVLGSVVPYQRTDGTTDLGITAQPCLNLDVVKERVDEVKWARHDQIKIDVVQKLIEYLQKKDTEGRALVTINVKRSAKDLYYDLRHELNTIRNSYFRTISYS
nr:hypothetical protein 13 [bacterium]